MQAVVLAAGRSSRFWPLNRRHKSLIRIRGRTLLGHTLDALADAGIDDVVVVQGPGREVEDAVEAPADVTVSYVVQEEPRGMGHALEQARDLIDGRFVVTGPYRVDAAETVRRLDEAAGDGAVAGVKTDHPERYGMLDIDGDRTAGIVEKPEGEPPSDYRVVSTYLLDADFFDHLDAVERHEYDFEDALDRYMDAQEVGFVELEDERPSLKYPWHVLGFAERLLEEQEPRVADSAEVADSATIEGNVVVGPRTRIYENAVVRGPAYIGADCTVGNNAVVRAHTDVEDGCTVGANAEVRGSVLQEGVSLHSGFVGDSVLDRDVAVGAGTITANRRVREDGDRGTVEVHVRARDTSVDTGRTRVGAFIGEAADIGTQANLMPGVCIGAGTFVGPSTMVRHNVGEDKRYFTVMEGRERERR